MTRNPALRTVLAAAALALVAGVALANAPLRLTSAGMSYKDASDAKKHVTKVGVDFSCAAGLTVSMTDKGKGALGDATVTSFFIDNLPKDALGQVVDAEALVRIGLFTPHPDGVSFRVDNNRPMSVLATTARRLAGVGCDVSAPAPGASAFAFRAGGASYRAVFGAGDGGTTVYLGR